MLISRVKLKNWRNFRDVDVALVEVSYLVIASEAKQPRGRAWGSSVKLARMPAREAHDDLGCFAPLAMTAGRAGQGVPSSLSRGACRRQNSKWK